MWFHYLQPDFTVLYRAMKNLSVVLSTLYTGTYRSENRNGLAQNKMKHATVVDHHANTNEIHFIPIKTLF